jgi:hypothetical protein
MHSKLPWDNVSNTSEDLINSSNHPIPFLKYVSQESNILGFTFSSPELKAQKSFSDRPSSG